MMRSPRSRRFLKWGASAGLGAILLVWAASGWWYCWGIGSRVGIGIAGGQISVATLAANHGVKPGWTLARTPEFDPWPGMPNAGRVGGLNSGWFVSIPFWTLAIPIVLLTGFAWRRDAIARRIERGGLFTKCEYDRSGLSPEAVCPECGTVPAATMQTAHKS